MSFNTGLLFNETIGLSDKVDAHFVEQQTATGDSKVMEYLELEDIPKDHRIQLPTASK